MRMENRPILLASGWIALCLLCTSVEAENSFIRGDVNVDGQVSLADVLMLKRYIFTQGVELPCLDAADVIDSGYVSVEDQIALSTLLFNDGQTLTVVPPGVENCYPCFPVPTAPYPEVGEDPTEDDLSCESYEVIPPAQSDDVLRVGDVVAAPGQIIDIPILLTNEVDIEAFQLVLAFNPKWLKFRATYGVGDGFLGGTFTLFDLLSFQGTFYEDKLLPDRTGPAVGVNIVETDDEDLAYLLVGFLPSMTKSGFEVPPSTEEQTVFHLRGEVLPGAPAGPLSLDLTNGPDGQGVGPRRLKTEIVHAGQARFVTFLPRIVGGVLNIVPDVSFFFKRGDANHDGAVDISDAVTIFQYLFLGTKAPTCPDAADANDDGEVDVSDAAATLGILFLDQGTFAPPGMNHCGVDPSVDALDCRKYNGCR